MVEKKCFYQIEGYISPPKVRKISYVISRYVRLQPEDIAPLAGLRVRSRETGGGEKLDALPAAAGLAPESNGKVSLTHAGRTDENDVLAALQVLAL